jgi:hypothetical protein
VVNLEQQFVLGILQDFGRGSAEFLQSYSNLKARECFHKIMATLFELVSSRQVQRPFSLDITEVLRPIEARFSQTLSPSNLILLLNDYRGLVSGLHKIDNFIVVVSCFLDEGVADLILGAFQAYSQFRPISKALLSLLTELSHSFESRISCSSSKAYAVEVGCRLYRHLLKALSLYLQVWHSLETANVYEERYKPLIQVLAVHSHASLAEYANIHMLANAGTQNSQLTSS